MAKWINPKVRKTYTETQFDACTRRELIVRVCKKHKLLGTYCVVTHEELAKYEAEAICGRLNITPTNKGKDMFRIFHNGTYFVYTTSHGKSKKVKRENWGVCRKLLVGDDENWISLLTIWKGE